MQPQETSTNLKQPFRLIFIFVLTSCLHNFSFSQATSIHVFQDWADGGGLTNQVYKANSAFDNTGNMYVVGGTINANGDWDWLITKYNPSTGNQIWSVSYDDNGLNDYITDIVIDASCNLYVTGVITNDTSSGTDIAIAQYDSSGSMQWIDTYDNGGSFPFYNDAAASITYDGSTYLYITGTAHNSPTMYDFCTLKYHKNGTQQWVNLLDHDSVNDGGVFVRLHNGRVKVTGIAGKSSGTNRSLTALYHPNGTLISTSPSSIAMDSITEIHDVTIASNGDIYIAGFLHRVTNGRDIKLIKLDSNLTYQWNYIAGGSDDDEANAVRLDSIGHVYIAGYKENGTKDYFITKLDTAGNAIWTETFNGSGNGNDIATAIAIDNQNQPIVTGYSWMDPGSNFDYYTIKYDTAGSTIWEINYNGLANKDDRAYEIALDDFDNVYVIGQSQDSSGVNSQFMTVKYVEHELWNVPDTDTIPSNFDVTPNLGQLLNADTVMNVNTTIKYYCTAPSVYFENTKLMHLS